MFGACQLVQSAEETAANAVAQADWYQGNAVEMPLGSGVNNLDLSFNAPQFAVSPLYLIFDSASSFVSIDWPTNIRWSGGTAPISIGLGRTLYWFLYDGANYYGLGDASGYDFDVGGP